MTLSEFISNLLKSLFSRKNLPAPKAVVSQDEPLIILNPIPVLEPIPLPVIEIVKEEGFEVEIDVDLAPVPQKLLIDPQGFKKFAPKALPGALEAIERAAYNHGLTEPGVLAVWLGQMHVESAGFSVVMESLNYSVESLRKTFGSHRITDEECQRYGRRAGRKADQEAIANIVYGGEWGRVNLGNLVPGDGWKHRGAGMKQITGKYNQELYAVTADDLADPVISADVAARFFVDHGCVPYARTGNIKQVTRIINGGYNALDMRIEATEKARKIVL